MTISASPTTEVLTKEFRQLSEETVFFTILEDLLRSHKEPVIEAYKSAHDIRKIADPREKQFLTILNTLDLVINGIKGDRNSLVLENMVVYVADPQNIYNVDEAFIAMHHASSSTVYMFYIERKEDYTSYNLGAAVIALNKQHHVLSFLNTFEEQESKSAFIEHSLPNDPTIRAALLIRTVADLEEAIFNHVKVSNK